MAHMIPVAEHFAAYHVDTNGGIAVVPESICGVLNLDENGMPDDVRVLLPYCEHPGIAGVKRRSGWYARLSADGYLDCTEWEGPFDSEREALECIKEQFDVDDNGDPDEHMPEDADDPLTIR